MAVLSRNQGDYSGTANTAEESREAGEAEHTVLFWDGFKLKSFLWMTCLCVWGIWGGFHVLFSDVRFGWRNLHSHLIASSLRHCMRDLRISAFRSLILDWSCAMLLLEILLLCEVCTLLLQMETLQSRHLPAQMDGLAVSFMRRQQNRRVVHLCVLHGMGAHQMA